MLPLDIMVVFPLPIIAQQNKINQKQPRKITDNIRRKHMHTLGHLSDEHTPHLYDLLFKSCRIAPQCLKETKSQQLTRRLFYIIVLFTSVHLQMFPR
jgi:hypothetical protein